MEITSIFDVLGPVMIGPSSSHTAGAVRLGLLARTVLGIEPQTAAITLLGSFAKTGRGHGTDRAILAGLLGLQPDDPDVRRARELADARKLRFSFAFEPAAENMHPNSVRMELTAGDRRSILWGSSLGAGQVKLWQIDEFKCDLDGKSPCLLVWHLDRPGSIGQVATICGRRNINISQFSCLRDQPGGNALMTVILDQVPDEDLLDLVREIENVRQVRALDALEPPRPKNQLTIPESLWTGDFSCDDFAKKIIELEARTTSRSEDQVRQILAQFLKEMKNSISEARQSDLLSPSRLVGREHVLWNAYFSRQPSLLGNISQAVVRDALALAAYNAKMGRIVAVPTAGSCGVLPAVIINLSEHLACPPDSTLSALAVAGMVGAMIGSCASLSGAECGCQAECGSASAMAAAALAAMKNQTGKTILNAAALAMKNHLGLTCDPVAGLVEIPCVKRNAFSALAALLASELACAGVESAIPFRQVVETMRQTGKMISPSLRESAEAGLADTPAAHAVMRTLSS